MNSEDTKDKDSKEALTILIQLVNIAQKKGAFDIHESFLAFNAISKFVDDPKMITAKQMIEKAFSSKDEAKNSKSEYNNPNDTQVNS